MAEIEIRPITEPDLGSALALVDEVFGPRQGSSLALERWASDPSFSLLGAFRGGKALGISLSRLESEGIERAYEAFGEFALREIQRLRKEAPAGSFQLLAVSREARREGLGERLSRRQLEWMIGRGCRLAIGVCWEHGGADSSVHLFTRAGFDRLGEAREFYLGGSRASAHVCPVCQGTCRCPASLWVLRLG